MQPQSFRPARWVPCVQTWHFSQCLSCKPGNPASSAAGSTPEATCWFWTASKPLELSILSGTDIINHARRNKTDNLGANHWFVAHAAYRKTSRQYVSNLGRRWCDCTCVCVAAGARVEKMFADQHHTHKKALILCRFEYCAGFRCMLVTTRTGTKGPSLPFKLSSCILPFKHIVLTASPL